MLMSFHPPCNEKIHTVVMINNIFNRWKHQILYTAAKMSNTITISNPNTMFSSKHLICIACHQFGRVKSKHKRVSHKSKLYVIPVLKECDKRMVANASEFTQATHSHILHNYTKAPKEICFDFKFYNLTDNCWLLTIPLLTKRWQHIHTVMGSPYMSL